MFIGFLFSTADCWQPIAIEILKENVLFI